MTVNAVKGERADSEDVHSGTWRDSRSAARADQLAVMIKISEQVLVVKRMKCHRGSRKLYVNGTQADISWS